MNFLDVSEGGHLVKYIGRGRDDSEAASVRSNAPLAPLPNPIGYFEGHVIDRGRDGYMSIGLMNRRTALDKLVGWGEGAVGYHGDDGNIFVGNGMGRSFGPLYGKGDTIGCGIDWINDRIFFTKNGSMIGSVQNTFKQDESVHVAIGLRTPGEAIRVNFGQSRFVFVIKTFIGESRKSALDNYIEGKLPSEQTVLQLIMHHCIYNGYADTLKCLLTHTDGEVNEHIESLMKTRLLQLKYLKSLKDQSLCLEGIEVAFHHLKEEGVGKVLFGQVKFVKFLLENGADTVKIMDHFLCTEDAYIDDRILALLSYGAELSADRPKNLVASIIDDFYKNLSENACCQDKLYETLCAINLRIAEGHNKSSEVSPKMSRFWSLINNLDLFIPHGMLLVNNQ
jgi:hypothetical protein